MIMRFSKDEIKDFISCLSLPDEALANHALSFLLVANPKTKLPLLIEALTEADDLAKQKICFIMGGMDDERCIDPLLSLLHGESIATRIAAIDALQFFHEPRIVPHLAEQFQSGIETVREQVIDTLAVFLKQGVTEAKDLLIDIINDENMDMELQYQALDSLENLEDHDLEPILDSLLGNPNAQIYARVLLLKDELEIRDPKERRNFINKKIEELLKTEDIIDQIAIQYELVELGETTAHVLLEKMFQDPQNTQLVASSQMILGKLGRKLIIPLKKVFESINKFDDIYKCVLLEHVMFSLNHPKYAPLTQSMLSLLNKINTYINHSDSDDRKAGFDILKTDMHVALATYGCRDAVDDLKELFGDGTQRAFITIAEAIQKIGDKDFIIPLINQYIAYQDEKKAKSAIKKAFVAIAKREGIKKNDSMFSNLTEGQRTILQKLFRK